MSLLTRLLDPELALIEKYALDEDGDLKYEMMQEALMKEPAFRKEIVAICKRLKEEAKNEKKK